MSSTDAGATPEFPLIGEHYQLLNKLGEGAFGEVYKAEHNLLNQDFAVKLLKPELSEDQDVQDRFLDEARALIRFSHPNVVQMRHVGRHEGRLFLVMDYIQGRELGDVMREDGAFDEKRALSIITQILNGLESAHAAGIVHRDLKPSNIMLEKLPDGSEKASILDFGLSKFSAIDGPGGAHRSITGTIVGTLAYMSPEQIKGESDIDGRSDMFAAGLILQEMLQGHHPYPGESGIVVAAKLLRDPIPEIDEDKRANISGSTITALGRALERDRDARFASVTAFAQSLEGRGPPSDTSKVTTIQDAQAELARQEAAAAKKAVAAKAAAKAEARGGKKSPLVPILAVVVLLLGAGGFFLFGQKKDTTDPDPTTIGKSDPPGDPEPAKSAPTDPEPAKSEPVKAEPGTSEPAKSEPVKGEPAKAEPVTPEPAKGEPTKAEPVTPEPAKGEPTKAEPVTPEPVKGEPTKAEPAKSEPVKSEPKKSEPATSTPGTTLSPEDCCSEAATLRTAGKWAEARALYVRAASNSALTDKIQIAALRGAAEVWIAEADQLARRGNVNAALARYADAGAWLDRQHAAYEKVERAVETARLQLGFSRLHQAEVETERARWFRILGKNKEASAELKKAAINFDFALQQLQRDGVRYWEFLIRRAEMHRLAGDSKAMMADVKHTTKTENNTPAHMWVAHATAARHVAEAYGARGDTGAALTWAKDASAVAESAVSWQDSNLTRAQWFALARTLFLQGTLLKGEDPTALHGKARYWIAEAAKVAAPAWEHKDVARARLLTAQAMERYLHGLAQRHKSKGAEAAKAFAEAATSALTAVQLREAAAKQGAVRVDPLPYIVVAAILKAQGKAAAAQAAEAKARAAATQNPD